MGINNINLAQNRTEDLAKDAGEKNLLKKSGMSEADIDAMKSEDREKKANKLLRDSENSKLSKEFSKEAIEKMSQAERERHLDRIEGVASVDNFTADQARLTQLLNQEANLVVKVKKELATLSATEPKELKTLTGQAKLKNFDSIVNNPYRSEVTKVEKQLACIDTKSADYEQLKKRSSQNPLGFN